MERGSSNKKKKKLNRKQIITIILLAVVVIGLLSGKISLNELLGIAPAPETEAAGSLTVVESTAAETKAASSTASAQTTAAAQESTKAAKTAAAETDEARTTEAATRQETSAAYTEYRFRSKNLLNQHYDKHGREMGFANAADYQQAASDVINNPQALHKTEKEDGDFVFYVEATNEFVVLSTDGYIRTYFKPDSGKRYYDKQ